LRPKAVKQRKHESANVSFCDPVQSTGFPKQTMIDVIIWILPNAHGNMEGV
jgi:hypothetical protein